MTGWTVLAGCGKTTLACENFEGRTYGTTAEHSRRMLKKAVQQGRRRVETGGVPSGAHGATNKEHQVCARRRVVRRPGPR